mgnify:CR=1 FL=1
MSALFPFDMPSGILRPLEDRQPPDSDPFNKLPLDVVRRILTLAAVDDEPSDAAQNSVGCAYLTRPGKLRRARRKRVGNLEKFCRTSILFRLATIPILYQHITVDYTRDLYLLFRTLIRNPEHAKQCRTFAFLPPTLITFKYPLPYDFRDGQVRLLDHDNLYDLARAVEHEFALEGCTTTSLARENYLCLFNNLVAVVWILENVETLSIPFPHLAETMWRVVNMRVLFKELRKPLEERKRFRKLKLLRVWPHRIGKEPDELDLPTLTKALEGATIKEIEILGNSDHLIALDA